METPPPKTDAVRDSLRSKLEAESRAAALKLLEDVQNAYGLSRSYSDHGYAVVTLWSAGTRIVEISYFETIFVRGEGLRIRFFDEQHRLQHGLWNFRDKTTLYSSGRVEAVTLREALEGLRGVSHGAGYIIPNLLVNRRIDAGGDWPSTGVALAGRAPIWCGRCRIVALRTSKDARQDLLTIDEIDHRIRRYQLVQTIHVPSGEGEPAQNLEGDVLVAYEGQMNGQEDNLSRELANNPWKDAELR